MIKQLLKYTLNIMDTIFKITLPVKFAHLKLSFDYYYLIGFPGDKTTIKGEASTSIYAD